MAAVRLASLRASAELDASKYAAGAARVDEANKKMAGSQGAVKASMQQTQARASESARAFDRYRQSLDPVFRAQAQLESGARRVQIALEKGQITAAEHARLMGSLQQRYGGAGAEATRLQASVGGLYGAFGNLRTILAGVGVLFAAREYFQFADTMTNISSRLRLVTGSTAELAGVQSELLRVANETRSGFESTVTLYARVARNADQLGLSQQKVLELTETVQQAIRVSGTTASEASAGVIQFSQALASGRLSGDEFRSVMENMPRLARAIADGLGVTVGGLRELANDQKLTAATVIGALQSQAGAIRDEFGQLPATVGEGFTVLNNNMLAFVGKVDSAAGASRDFGATITSLSETLNDPDTVAAGVAIVNALAAALDFVAKAATGAYLAIKDFGELADLSTTFLGPEAERKAYLDGTLNKSVSSKFFYNAPVPGVVDTVAAPNFSVRQPANDNLARPIGSVGGAVNRERERAAKADGDRQKALEEYIESLEVELRLSKLTGVERKREEAILRATKLVQDDRIKGEEKLSDLRRREISDLILRQDLEEKRQAALEEQAREQEQAMEDAKRRVQQFNDEVLGETAGAIANIWEGGKGGFDETLQYWKRRLIAWLAEMAAKLVLSPIIMPILQSAGLGAGALGSATGGLGANFGSQGVGGVSSLGASLGSLGKSIDQFGRDLGLQKGGATGPFADGTGLFGTNTALSDVAGGALGGIGIGATVATLTGGNSLGGSIGGLVGGALGSFLGPLGSLLGSAVGGFLGSLFKGGKPTNATARIDFDQSYNRTNVPFSKETAETRGAINNAADQIVGVVNALEQVGTTFNDRLSAIAIGVRDPSYIQFESGKLLRSGVGDPNALALTAIKELLRTASFTTASLATVAKRDYGSLQELTSALDFVRNTYDAIAEARPGLTQTEQAMKDLSEGLKSARREAERLGLSVDKLDIGARTLFDRDVSDQIRAITDPVGLALQEFERGAVARVETAKKLGADLVGVEKLNALQRAQVLKQVQEQSFAGLKSLIDDLAFGSLSVGVAPSEQYFSALSRYNEAKRTALDTRTPEAIGDFESYSRSLIPVAQGFLGVSTRFGDLRSDILSTARTLGAPSDPSTQAIITATTQGAAATVEAIGQVKDETKKLGDKFDRLNAFLQAVMTRFAA